MALGAEVGVRLSYLMEAATSGPWAVSDLGPTGLDGTRGGVHLHPDQDTDGPSAPFEPAGAEAGG